jgi:hypothetical protein
MLWALSIYKEDARFNETIRAAAAVRAELQIIAAYAEHFGSSGEWNQ